MAGSEQVVLVDGRRLRVTNLDKVVYPATGTTKGEIIAYYSQIAAAMLPHLRGRPVTRKRWVEGVGTADAPEPSFFAKQLEPGAPDWVRRMPIEHSDGPKDYPLADDVATLAWFAQVAALELHVPQWRFTHSGGRGFPDRLVLDLDPGPGVGLAQCAEVARIARGVLSGMGLEPIPVTSGSKGIHLYARLPTADDGTGMQSSDDVSAVAKELARLVGADHPDLATHVMAKSARSGKVFIDWSQNSASKTTISPYSLRGRARPWVAAPRTWDELDDPQLRQLEFHEVLERVDAGIDPLAPLASPAPAPGLSSYLAKRDAARTPEPMPKTASASTPGRTRFVVQEHHARRLHYDLRIERDGVLISWAVPKGIPETATGNHLAVMTEPHPLEYLEFEGEIPRGEYGAGSMTVWDTGTVALEKWRDDEVIGTFTGQIGGRLGSARLALIRTSGEGEKSQWLLHRMKESSSPPVRERPKPSPVPERPSSRFARSGTEKRDEGRSIAPMLSSPGTAGLARALSTPAWAEIKWDGIRAIGTWSGAAGGHFTLRARSGTDITARYPELTADGNPGFPASDAVVDGEIVAFDAQGRPSFSHLQNRMHLTRAREIEREVVRTPVVYLLFDLLRLDGHDLTALPLRQRRELLEQLASDLDAPVQVPPVFDDLDEALRLSREYGLEGVVAKDPASPYLPGIRAGSWLKLKNTRTQEVVIVGIRPGQGNRAGSIGSLLLAVPDAPASGASTGALRYVGRVGTGFTDRMLRDLDRALQPLRVDDPPLQGVPALDSSDALWVRPELVGEVEFANWSPGGILRHARWRGLRSDKTVGDVRAEG